MLVNVLAEAIIDGNEIYENLAISGQLTDPNLDLMEALGPVREKYPLFTEWPVLAMNGVSPTAFARYVLSLDH